MQAPKVRTPQRDPKRNRNIILAVSGGTLLLAAAIAGFFLLSGDSGAKNEGVIATLRDAGCTYENPRAQGRQHVAELPPGYKANSTPRSSGPHAGETLVFGTYRDEVPELNAVHNLEHGAVFIWFGPRVPEQTITEINDFYDDDPNGMIVARHPRLGDDIAFVAWTHVARCTRFDPDAAEEFVDAFRGRGPEPFEIEDLQPGGG